jgi:hypothetical protein
VANGDGGSSGNVSGNGDRGKGGVDSGGDGRRMGANDDGSGPQPPDSPCRGGFHTAGPQAPQP